MCNCDRFDFGDIVEYTPEGKLLGTWFAEVEAVVLRAVHGESSCGFLCYFSMPYADADVDNHIYTESTRLLLLKTKNTSNFRNKS